jgi:hypothetical protein
MSHNETLIGLIVLDALEHILKTHQVQVVRVNGLQYNLEDEDSRNA